jgi:hypothetical protein
MGMVQAGFYFCILYLSLYRKTWCIFYTFEPYLSSLPSDEYCLSLTLRSSCFIKVAQLFLSSLEKGDTGQCNFLSSAPTARRDNSVVKSADAGERAQTDGVKGEWKLLWLDRIDDKFRAEGIASGRFRLLAVERGTVIVATRDYKKLDLREILRSHSVQDVRCV